LYYDRSRPYKKDIRYLKEYKSVKNYHTYSVYYSKSVLEYYGSIKSNEITFTRLAKDTLIEVESYKIADYKTSSAPYEGHYIHRDTKLVSKTGFRQRGMSLQRQKS
jgi:hypothetical protein